jgi:hypothetical protein
VGQVGAQQSNEAQSIVSGYSLDEVTLDKSKICANEDVRVDIRASWPPGEGDWLVPLVKVPGSMARGFNTILRTGGFALPEVRQQFDGMVTVDLVDLRLKQVVASKRVPLEVDDCEAPTGGLVVDCQWRQTRIGDADCTASVPSTFTAVRYEWSVLDPEEGELPMAKVTTPRTLFTLPRRAQTRLEDTFMIEARAFDATGAQLMGRGFLARVNTRWQTAQEGGVLELEPIFDAHPRRSDDKKSYVTHVEVENPFNEPVDLTEVTVTTVACAEGDASGAATKGPPLPAGSIFGSTNLMPLARVAYDWKLPIDAKRCLARADLKGIGVKSGLPASATWVMPTDPQMRAPMSSEEGAWLRQTLKILSKRRGKPVLHISTEEIERLELEGVIPPRHQPSSPSPSPDAPPPDAPPPRPPAPPSAP